MVAEDSADARAGEDANTAGEGQSDAGKARGDDGYETEGHTAP
jgi:hypothetical protein